MKAVQMQKQKRNKVTKQSGNEKAKVNCDKIYSDIITIKSKDGGEIMPRNNLHIIVDERTGYKFL